MAAPQLLSRQDIAGYGVDVDSDKGFDFQNKRYNTNQSGQYLYHGDVGGGNIGWYTGGESDPLKAAATPQQGPPISAPGDVPANAANPLQQQGQAAQSYSATPTAAPTQTTTNQGTQDVVRNSYLQQALQPKTIDMNDPVLRQQADAYGAAQERARRGTVAQNAETYGATGQVGAEAVQDRMANEMAAQNRASFEAQLVGNELKNRREEIQNALTSLSGLISGDQARGLQKELADIDAQIKQAGLSQSGALGGRELDIKQQLGLGGLNVDLLRTILQNQQANNDLGFRIGDREAFYDQSALNTLLGG